MADFIPKFRVDTSDCTELLITDPTGIYSATNPQNLTGWGVPNPSISDVDTATLSITTKDSAIPYEINVFPTLPNITGAIYTLLPAQIGYTTKIPTQVLKIVYTVTGILPSGVPFTYSSYCLIGVLCDIQCCVDRLNADAVQALKCKCTDACSCKCKCPDEMITFMKAYTLLYGLRKQIKQKQFNMANETLNMLNLICNCQ